MAHTTTITALDIAYAVCTECGGRSGTQYDGAEPIPLMTQLCPNCGAKMDGGAD